MRLLHVMPLFALVLAGTSAPPAAESHPRIWLTSATLAALRVKARSGDEDWRAVKAAADRLAMAQMPRFTVTAATNTNPVQLTIAETVPWAGSTPLFIAGAAGAWTPLNT